jgi:Protein of unknown function (DUF3096)
VDVVDAAAWQVHSPGTPALAWRCNQHQTTAAGNLKRWRHRPVNAPIDTAQRLSDPRARVRKRRGIAMEVVVLPPLVALIAGILILIVPRLLNYIVAIYLILIGLLGLFGHYSA